MPQMPQIRHCPVMTLKNARAATAVLGVFALHHLSGTAGVCSPVAVAEGDAVDLGICKVFQFGIFKLPSPSKFFRILAFSRHYLLLSPALLYARHELR